MSTYIKRDSLGRTEILGKGEYAGEVGLSWGGIKRGLKKGVKVVGKGAYKYSGAKAAVSATKWTGSKLASAANWMANKAAWPIKRAARPAVVNTAKDIAKSRGHAAPTKEDKKLASQSVIKAMRKSKNPMVRTGAFILNKFGTGVSGGTSIAGTRVYHPISTNIPTPAEMGLTGVEIAALSTGIAAAVSLSIAGITALARSIARQSAPPPQEQALSAPDGEYAEPGAESSESYDAAPEEEY